MIENFCNLILRLVCIIVTDAFHFKRSLFTFSKIISEIAPYIKTEVSAALNDVYNKNTWWTTYIGFRIYIREGVKIIYYFVRLNLNTPGL